MSLCNYCTLKGIQAHAEKCGGIVVLRPRPTEHSAEGVDAFIQYADFDLESVGNVPIMSPRSTWAAWFMKLPERCACHE